MTDRVKLKTRIQALKPGDVVCVSTDVFIQNREFHVDKIRPAEQHRRDKSKHYRVYVNGPGNSRGVGKYVIHLDRPEWDRRTSVHDPPELFYIEDEGTPAGTKEYTEGSITSIKRESQ